MRGTYPPVSFADPPLPRPPRAHRRRLRRAVHELLDPIRSFYQFSLAAWELVERLEAEHEPWGVIEVWLAVVERAPAEHRNHLHLADAWAAVGDVEAALEAAGSAHRLQPSCLESQELLVELLFAAGRDWHAYPWVERPVVTLLDEETRERCAAWLEGQLEDQGASDCFDLMFELFEDEVCLFDDGELGLFLACDPRFEVKELPGAHLVALREAAGAIRELGREAVRAGAHRENGLPPPDALER